MPRISFSGCAPRHSAASAIEPASSGPHAVRPPPPASARQACHAAAACSPDAQSRIASPPAAGARWRSTLAIECKELLQSYSRHDSQSVRCGPSLTDLGPATSNGRRRQPRSRERRKPQQPTSTGGTADEGTSSKASVAVAALVASSAIAWADCGIEKGSVRILSNDFEALHVVASGAEECASPDRQGHQEPDDRAQEHPGSGAHHQSRRPTPSPWSPTTPIVPLLNGGLVRPLDDYVAK